jgi:hypothetical protein
MLMNQQNLNDHHLFYRKYQFTNATASEDTTIKMLDITQGKIKKLKLCILN